jgi:hypothetical protein
MQNHDDVQVLRRIAYRYLIAKERLIEAGYSAEIDRHDDLRISEVTEQQFLQESAWVILCTGMREAVIRRLFGPISSAFFRWTSASEIYRCAAQCRDDALALFRNARKIDGILSIARYVATHGFGHVKERLHRDGLEFLQLLPFIGPVTSRHLAKNLGISIAKPDRHLVRIASALRYASVDLLCADIAALTQHPIHVIDLVLWRYATLNPGYQVFFSQALSG